MCEHRLVARPRYAVVMLLLLAAAGCDTGKSADDYIRAAQERRGAGDIAAAIIDFKNALQKDPKNWHGRILLAQSYLDLPDPIAAEAELQRARQDGADAAFVAKPLAQAELLLDKPGAALRETELPAEVPAEIRAGVMAVRAEALM